MAEAKPKCRLYLQLPVPVAAKVEAQLARVLANADVACVLLCQGDDRPDDAELGRLIDVIQSAGSACLIDGEVELAARLGADGVHIGADIDAVIRARALLGEGASIGASCGLSRDDAMRLAEAGADYVAFGPAHVDSVTDPIGWWAEISVVPCVAWDVANAADAARVARAGADFVALSRAIWQDGNPAGLITEIGNAIAQARRAA